MAADVASDADPPNPCCAKLRKKLSKLEESRNALRKAVKILEEQINKLERDNATLKKLYEEQEKVALNVKAKEEESGIILKLEKEINDLKAEISAYQQQEMKDQTKMLEGCISERNSEIKVLKEHIAKEKTRADSEKKKAEVERNKASEEKKLLELDKRKAEVERKNVENERKKLEGCISERDTEIQMLKECLMKEKTRVDSEKKKAEVERKKASEVKKFLEVEKKKAEDERKHVELERKKAEEVRLSLERLKAEVDDARGKLMAERAKAHEVTKLIDEEKKKNIVDKKHAVLQREKVEKLTRAMEAQRKEAEDAKVLVEHMKQTLEDEKQKKDKLENKLVAIMRDRGPAGGGPCSHAKKWNDDTSLKAGTAKALKQQLKFEKKRQKYAKRMAKLEKSEKILISQQYHLLRQDYIQLSNHLKMLGDELSRRSESTLSLTKTDGSSDLLRFNLQNNASTIRCSEDDYHLSKYCKGSFPIYSSTRECSCFDASRGRYFRQISGIKSDVDFTKIGSFRTKPQSSTVCSTSATCSDRELMCSQGADAAFLATSSQLPEGFLNNRLIIPNLPRQDAENVQNKVTVVEGDNNLNGAQRNKDTDKVIYSGGKKRKRHDLLPSVKPLCDKDKLFNSETKEKLFTRKDLMSTKGSFSTAICRQESGISNFNNDQTGPVIEVQDDICRRCHKSFRHTEDKQKTVSVQLCSQGLKDKSGTDCSILPNFPNKSASVPLKINENNCANQKEKILAVNDDQTDLACFNNVIRENFMKLLALDSEDDERRYMEAMERPLSPTLPGNIFSEDLLKGEDQSHYLVETIFRKPGTGADSFEPHRYFDVIDLEIDSNKLKLIKPAPTVSKDAIRASEGSERDGVPVQRGTSDHDAMDNTGHNFHHGNNNSVGVGMVSIAGDLDVLRNSSDFASSVKNIQENLQLKPILPHLSDTHIAPGLNVCSAPVTRDNDQPEVSGYNFLGTQTSDSHKIPDPKTIVKTQSDMNLSSSSELQNLCGGNVYLEGATGYCVIFADSEDEGSIARIVHARNTLASEDIRRSHLDSNIMEVLHRLESIIVLQPEEKVCVFFSLLLSNICGLLFANSKSSMVGDILQFTKSFAKEIHKVISDEASYKLFSKVCPLDILLNLSEDFLIRRRILMCNTVESKQLCSILSSKAYHLKGLNMFLTEIAAKTEQLLAASILSASVCAALDQIGFLLEISYRVLRFCKIDTKCNLLMLHIFSFASGERFCTVEKYNYLASAIKSVALQLERGHESHLSCHSTSDVDVVFSPCEQCPFSKDTVCIETFASSLMDILQDFASTGASSVCSFVSSSNTTTNCYSRVGESISVSTEPDVLDSESEASCVLLNYRNNSSDYISRRALCQFTDVVSVVELLGCYMGWKWTSDNLLPRLLTVSKLFPPNEFSAATVVLIGQLGRFGIDFGGYQHIEISQLRCNLSTLLETYIKEKCSFPGQLAAVDALLNLLPISFKEIVDVSIEHSFDDNQYHQIKLLKEWFSHLDKKKQFLVSNLFSHAADQ
ncbi:hypothetical protein Cni_G21178 [Canna indica]|uniref:Maternal effect embryo arrest 22 n=1 Tax=Canna indica TaxID=4628 RepID=A0AAQ3QGY7_9LILI|nr:hypothetical protein Cni_G21178 [Canna indica]